MLPHYFDGLLFPWSFVALEARFLGDELATRAERYERRRARRKYVFHQPSFCFRPHHKNLCQHRDHLWIKEQPKSDATRLDSTLRKTVIESATLHGGSLWFQPTYTNRARVIEGWDFHCSVLALGRPASLGRASLRPYQIRALWKRDPERTQPIGNRIKVGGRN